MRVVHVGRDTAVRTGGLHTKCPDARPRCHDARDEPARAAYPADTYIRLQRVKARYDPDNLFRGNLNILPAET